MGELATKIKVGIEECILITLIALSLLAMVVLLPGDVHFAKKIVAWAGMGYLFYRIGLSELLFGVRNRWTDGLLILSYFSLILKDFFTFSKGLTKEAFLLFDFTVLFQKSIVVGGDIYLLKHTLAETIEFYALGLGITIIACLALTQTLFRREIRRPSVLGMLHDGFPSSFGDRLWRSLTSFLVFMAFFLFVFNLAMEWLAWVIHSWITIFAVFFYFFFFIKYHKEFHVSTMIYKIGSTGHGFYHRFLDLLKDRSTVLLAVSGMLVLHLLTDMATFIIPYLIGKEASYFAALGPGHDPLIVPLLKDMAAVVGIGKLAVAVTYVLNALAAVFLFLGPAFIWRAIYHGEAIVLPKAALALFYPAILAFLAAPAFIITKLEAPVEGASIVGVDIMTQGLPLARVLPVLAVGAVLAAGIPLLMRMPKARAILTGLAVMVVQLFLGFYVFYYFVDVVASYLALLVSPGLPALFLVAFIAFFLLTVAFYASGFLAFAAMPWRRSLVTVQQAQ